MSSRPLRCKTWFVYFSGSAQPYSINFAFYTYFSLYDSSYVARRIISSNTASKFNTCCINFVYRTDPSAEILHKSTKKSYETKDSNRKDVRERLWLISKHCLLAKLAKQGPAVPILAVRASSSAKSSTRTIAKGMREVVLEIVLKVCEK